MGVSGFIFSLCFASGERFRIEVYIDTGDKARNKKAFDLLELNKQEIESRLGVVLEWERLNHRKASRISWYYTQQASIMDSESKLENLRAWIIPSFFKYRQIMLPYTQKLALSFSEDYYEEAEE